MNGLSIKQDSDINESRKEYQSLKWRAEKKIDTFDYLFWIVHLLLILAVTTFVGFRTYNISLTILAALASGYIPGMIVSVIVTLLLDHAIGKRFERYLDNRRLTSTWYQRFEYLSTFIPEYEEAEKIRLAEEKRVQLQRLAEEKRIRLQPVSNEIQRISDEVEKIEEVIKASENVIWRKRKWYAEYREYEDAIEECIPMLDDFESQGRLVKTKFAQLAEEVSYEFYALSRKISGLKQRCQSVLAKMQGMKDWTPPVQTRSSSRTARNTITFPSTPIPTRPSDQLLPLPSLVTSNSALSEVQQPVVVSPPQPPKRREFNALKKIPFEDYVGMAKAKMAIGELGEIVVLHYELRRVEEETGLPSLGMVVRVSEQSDNLGYDIESFSEDDKVYIEVKSTSGGFWKDFFLSANERRMMDKLEERYWLYRIFDLSKEDGSAKLSIFRGKAEIEATFELEPTNYKFVAKNDFTGESTLPFEEL